MSNKKEVLFLREEYGEGRGKYTYPNGEYVYLQSQEKKEEVLK